jgi:phosphate:Na+ symporter
MVHFHTLFNLGVGLLCLPLVTPLSRLMRHLIAPAPVTALSAPVTYLDTQALESPNLALANATRETLAMADEVKLMLQSFWRAQTERDRQLAATVHEHDDRIDDTAAELTEYLVRISQEDLGEEEGYWQFALLSCVNELESAADIIDKNLCDFVRKQAGHGFPMTAQDQGVLEELYNRVRTRCDLVIGLITTRDSRRAAAFLAEEQSLEDWCRAAQRAHYDRLRTGDERALQSSVYFLDMLGSFRRINSHFDSIAYAFLDEADEEGAPVFKVTTETQSHRGDERIRA